jgi:hypothetical protein
VVSACIVGNCFYNMGRERLECGSRAVVQVVHTNDINFRIKCSVAKRQFYSVCEIKYRLEYILGKGDIR